MSRLPQVSRPSFDQDVLQSPLPVLVDFYADWCGPCRMLPSMLDRLSGEYAGRVKILKVNVDTEPQLAEEYRVELIPLLVFFAEGRPVGRVAGPMQYSGCDLRPLRTGYDDLVESGFRHSGKSRSLFGSTTDRRYDLVCRCLDITDTSEMEVTFMRLMFVRLVLCLMVGLSVSLGTAQDKSVKPGVNDSFRDPDVKQFAGRFEVESREVFAQRQKIVEACQIRSGQTVADIGAGTGLFTRMFSEVVGKDGRVLAVDISQKFLDHILKTSREAGQTNVEPLLCSDDSTGLPENSIDVAFICDTYHHFEYPLKTMASLFRAMKPGGRVILIDFKRIEGESSEWTLNHVRAGQEVFEAEVLSTGFQKVREERELFQENYFVVFEKPLKAAAATDSRLVFPVIAGHGGVVHRPAAVDQPRAGAKVIFDVTADAKPNAVNKGLDRVARLVNLYGASGLSPKDVTITVVLHGEATKAALSDAAYKTRFDAEQNPNLALVRELQMAGVEVLVCGQALSYQNFADNEVAPEIHIAAAAITVIINRQLDGFAYIPVH